MELETGREERNGTDSIINSLKMKTANGVNGNHANGSAAEYEAKSLEESLDETSSQLLSDVYKVVVGRGLVGPGEEVAAHFDRLVNFKQPAELERILNLKIEEEPSTGNDLLKFVNKVVDYSIKTTHPNFYNQLYGGIDKFGLAGAWLTDALNSSLATYETSPVYTLLERRLLSYMGVDLIGYPTEGLDGIFTPGGSSANTYAMVMARQRIFPESRSKGIQECGKLVAFVSEEAHYSFRKAAIWLGSGTESVIPVKSDSNNRMDANDLREKIRTARSNGHVPYFVAATSGTTVMGAYDPLQEIAEVCRSEGGFIWFHVDAAQGGMALFSPKYRGLMKGVELSDSVTWDWHKTTCVPFQCSVVITRHADILRAANALNADYIFQKDKYYDRAYDLGEKSIQCGRKADSLKAWMWLSGHGTRHIQAMIENIWLRAAELSDLVKSTPGFLLVTEPISNNIAFYYVPSAWRQELQKPDLASIQQTPTDLRASIGLTPDLADRLHRLAPAMKKIMMERGKLMIGYCPSVPKSLPNFWRLTLTCTPATTTKDLQFVLTELQTIGELAVRSVN